MRSIISFAFAIPGSALLVTACAGDPGLTTAAVAPKPIPTASYDPMCATLRGQITTLQGEGTVGRVEKAADGKTRSVIVKRAALAKVAELNRLNTEYRTRCSNPAIKTTSTVTPAAANVAPPAAVTAAATSAAQQRAQAVATKAAVKAAQ